MVWCVPPPPSLRPHAIANQLAACDTVSAWVVHQDGSIDVATASVQLQVFTQAVFGGGACVRQPLFGDIDDTLTCVAGCCDGVVDEQRSMADRAMTVGQSGNCSCSSTKARGALCDQELNCSSVGPTNGTGCETKADDTSGTNVTCSCQRKAGDPGR